MTTTLYVTAIIVFLISAFSLKSTSEMRKEAREYLVRARVLTYLASIVMASEKTKAVEGKPLPDIPSVEEMELLYERAMVSPAQARVVLSVLEDVMKENNIVI